MLLLVVASAETLAAASSPPPRPTLRAQRISEPPVVDGEVLGEPLWQAVAAASDFVQEEPDEGQPASEKTEVRIAFDGAGLYIGVVCYDSDASSLVVSDSRRDASLDEEDSFRIVLDTFRDRQNGFVFGTNVAGIQYDGQVTNEGRGGDRGPSRGASGFNLDWNTTWSVATVTGDFGWSAEFAIPFRSLRYDSEQGTWGVNFERHIRRKSETSHWSPLASQFDLFRVSEAGSVTGVEAPTQRNLQIVPYVLGSGTDGGVSASDEELDGGLDVKYGITPSLTLDVTVNTDFAQVEADDQQINLDRFSLFFPEKRPFFLENAGLFNVGDSGTVDLFFSRRIGLEDGEPVPILGGVRVSGRAAGLNVGFLNMQTEDVRTQEGEEIPANNFTVARVSREFPNRSRAGAIVVNREGVGSLAVENDRNRTVALDGQLGIGRYAELSGWAARTSTPGLEGDDHAFGLDASYSSPAWRGRARASEVGNEFNPEVGFLSRSDYRRLNGFLLRRFRPPNRKRVKEIGPRLYYDSYWSFDGFHETERYSLGGDLELRNGARVSFSAGGSLEGLQEPFEIADGVVIRPGRYSNNGFFVFFHTARGRAVSLGGIVRGGGFFDGDQVELSPSLRLRLGDYLSSELSWSHHDVSLASGSFKTNLGKLRVTYAFSTSVLVQALLQYNDVNDNVSTNLRFSWLGAANTGLFVVYNEIREIGLAAVSEPERSLIVKYSHVFDVFR